MDTMSSLRDHVVRLLHGGQAYEPFESIVGEFLASQRGVVPPGAEHSAWEIVEHMRITQRDILDFSRSEKGGYVEMQWPQDYWPGSVVPPDHAWEASVASFLTDRSALEGLVQDDAGDLFRPLPAGDGQTLLREALLAADHASYHLGQLVILRRLLDAS